MNFQLVNTILLAFFTKFLLAKLASTMVGNFFLLLQNNTQKNPFTNSPANGRAIFTICGLKGN